MEEKKLRPYRPNTQDDTHTWTNFKTYFLENGDSANVKATRLLEHFNKLFPKAVVFVVCAFENEWYGVCYITTRVIRYHPCDKLSEVRINGNIYACRCISGTVPGMGYRQ